MGQDFEKDAVVFALENQRLNKLNQELIKKNIDLSSCLQSMVMCFDVMSRDGGWDTLDEVSRGVLTKYREEARQVLVS